MAISHPWLSAGAAKRHFSPDHAAGSRARKGVDAVASR